MRGQKAPLEWEISAADFFKMTKHLKPINHSAEPARLLPGQNRLRLLGILFSVAFTLVGARLVQITLLPEQDGPSLRHATEPLLPRPDIVDRNGVLLATDLPVASIFADPSKIIDVDEAVEALTATIPELDASELRRRLAATTHFAWIKRRVSPEERDAVYSLGIPGVSYINERRRVYPQGRISSHVVGYVDLDNKGIAGIEKYLDGPGELYTASLADPSENGTQAAQLSLDIRVQAALVDEISNAIDRFKAIAGGGLVMDVKTGEVLSLVSLPDFNPNEDRKAFTEDQINRMTAGVYELGSVIKAVTFAMALDYGTATINSQYDARFPLSIGRARIDDFHATRRVLSLAEVFTNSSNIGTAKMALEVGPDRQQEFLRRVGLLDKLQTELPEAARPLLPKKWSKLATAQVAFGQGFAVQPLQGAAVVSALLNSGRLMTPTFLRRDEQEVLASSTPVVRKSTSDTLRRLFRLNVLTGSATKADVIGYRVGGKTGTAQKVVNGRYADDQRLATFIGALPMDDPRYLVMVMLDDPKPIPGTFGFATAGWNAVPTAANIIERIAPMLGIQPEFTSADLEKLGKVNRREEKR